MKDNTIYVLSDYISGDILGTFTSRRMLKSAVDHYSKIDESTGTYIFQAFMKNYIPGNLGKRIWAYIGIGNMLLFEVATIGINLVGKPVDDIEVE